MKNKRVYKWLFVSVMSFLVGFIVYFILTIVVAFLFEYQPRSFERVVNISQKAEKSISANETQFSVLTWNIGYCGLGKEQDFFYDGGNSVRPSKNDYQKYLNQAYRFLSKENYLDFINLQEVDLNSKRSYRSNQLDLFKDALPNMSYSFASNYKVDYIPIPISEPMGRVNAGLVSWSRYIPKQSDRIGFDANFTWWKRIFMLDRCLLVSRFNLPKGKELVMINLHNSAFDDENILKPKELGVLKRIVLEEYEKGNYVVAGGDWNQNPPGYKSKIISSEWNPTNVPQPIEKTLLPSTWNWVCPEKTPTNRFTDQPFKKGETKTTTIDFFVTSPNVKVLSVEALDLGFEFSDHQPVLMMFELVHPESVGLHAKR